MEWMLMPLRRYAHFRGRSRRKEYWLFALLYAVVYVAALTVDYSMGYGTASTSFGGGAASASVSGWGPATLITSLAMFLPSVAVGVRRLHDIDRSGWWLLLALVPLIGGIVLLVFFCLEGTRGSNRFGVDPKREEHQGLRMTF